MALKTKPKAKIVPVSGAKAAVARSSGRAAANKKGKGGKGAKSSKKSKS